MGLAKAMRLKGWQTFQTVYQQGKRYRGSHLMLRVLARPHLTDCQFGIAVSKKVSKKAVLRNRLKRQIRSLIRFFLPRLQPGWQVVIVVLPSAVTCKYEHFLRELEQLLNQAEMFHHGH